MAFGGRSQLKMSEETFDFVCTACAQNGKTAEAVKYCVECSGYCCQSCTDTHNWLPILKSHNLMEVSQGKQASGDQPSVLEFPTERCSIHKGKVVDMYCESHDAVGCYVCIAKDHKSCQESHIHSIPDMIEIIFKLSDCKQTHTLLKDMMVTMETVSKSKDTKLQILNKSKKEALDKVNTFEKALEAILRQRAESSRQEIEDVYQKLETDILGCKHAADSIRDDLKMADDKLKESEGNRAQRFVCSKIAQKQIKEAEIERTKPQVHNTDVQITFTPDQSLTEYVKALQGIGQVQYNVKQKHDLYKQKESRDINIRLSDDRKTCWSRGCCLTPDDQLLVTDCDNKKLKRVDLVKMTVVDYCTLDSKPYGICCISKHEVVVACQSNNGVQFVSICDQMTPTKTILMYHDCYGINVKDNTLYVSSNNDSLYVYNMTGTLLKTISKFNVAYNYKHFVSSKHIAFNECGNRMFVGDAEKGVACFDDMGSYLYTIIDNVLSLAVGVCVDGRGNLFVVGLLSGNVVQFSENGNIVGVVVKGEDGLQSPLSVCFHQGLNKMFVTMEESDVVKMYKLK